MHWAADNAVLLGNRKLEPVLVTAALPCLN
jgi:hypothetical protein